MRHIASTIAVFGSALSLLLATAAVAQPVGNTKPGGVENLPGGAARAPADGVMRSISPPPAAQSAPAAAPRPAPAPAAKPAAPAAPPKGAAKTDKQ